MPVRPLLLAAILVATVIASATPAVLGATEGTMTIGVHVTLVSRWLDPAETEALITPFMVLCALHDAQIQKIIADQVLVAPIFQQASSGVGGRASSNPEQA
jgi:hypothetical protein